MLGLSVESAILAALIGFVGALIGQFVAVFLGARYAANLNRRTQIELADLTFQREWRDKLVRPTLNLAAETIAFASGFSSALRIENTGRALEIAETFSTADVIAHAAMFATLGDVQLSDAGNAWMDAADRLGDQFAHLAEVAAKKRAFEKDDVANVAHALFRLVDATGDLYFEAGHYIAGRSDVRFGPWWRFWRG